MKVSHLLVVWVNSRVGFDVRHCSSSTKKWPLLFFYKEIETQTVNKFYWQRKNRVHLVDTNMSLVSGMFLFKHNNNILFLRYSRSVLL